jgi:DNA-binding MarR family transcriptional regulator
VDTEARRDLQALEAIADNDRITQRRLSTTLGIALGLTNLYLKRLVRKGYVKCVSIRPNRIRYLLTPAGIAEKTRLSYEFMDYSLQLYGHVRQHLRRVLEPLAAAGHRRVAIYGSGEAAELAYLSIIELGLELVAVFDGTTSGTFLGRPVLDVREHHTVPFDAIVVATLDQPGAIIDRLVREGVPIEDVVTLHNDWRASAGSRAQDLSRKKPA